MVILREKKQKKKDVYQFDAMLTQEKHDVTSVEYGICVDIGTTNLVLCLWELSAKKFVGSKTKTNPQTAYGADVMMRIMHAQRKMAEKLQKMVFTAIEEMLDEVLLEQGVLNWEDIKLKRMMIVGNTAMCHLFFGKNVDGLAFAPFTAAYQGNYTCKGEDLSWKRFARTSVSVLSGIASHVGSDALAVLGALGMGRKNKIELAVDLGTNAEMLLSADGRLYCCSAAAGPALEGRGTACGMKGKKGAVAGVKLAAGTGNMILETIGGTEPEGICATGLIDLLYELKKIKLIAHGGCLLSKEEALKENMDTAITDNLVTIHNEHCFLLWQKKDGKKIYLEQNGIRQIQLMAGAVYAGINCLLEKAGCKLQEVDMLYVAGSLGNNISIPHAIQTGLLPPIPAERISLVGNCAAEGCCQALLSPDFYQKMEKTAKKIEHIELAEHKSFQKYFIQGMEQL